MDALYDLYYYTNWTLFWALAALRVWTIADCVTRKAAAFPAVDKLTKPAWLAILVISGVIGQFIGGPAYPFSLISAVICGVYLADVRPAVREISGG
ncbi:DUF2516 family protein [uncultured Jatrophihabitans sp.]|uniref:DUF2516 family protein n=1 Tax=uncultured Jatrophihabitans sp. TaxID=1610747 RepID=UPI0035CC2095